MTHIFVDKIRKYQEVLKSTSIYVVDVETTLISKDKYKTVYNTPPKYVCHGWVNCTNFDKPSILWNSGNLFDGFRIRNDLLLVGHNISYDTFIASTVSYADFKVGAFIWDTMLAEYLLTNQIERMPSLEQCCENHGITMRKDEEVAQLMKAGVCPSTIPKDKLKEYLKGDLLMTKEVFKKQREQFYQHPPEWQVMFINQMFFLLNTLRASWNGMKIDEEFVEQNKVNLRSELAHLEGWLTAWMEIMSGVPAEYWNPASNKDLTVLLYGGVKEWTEREQVGVYKTGLKVGQPRWKLNKKGSVLGARFKGQSSVDEAALKECKEASSRTGDATMVTFLDNLLKYKDTSKNYNTYFEGYMNFATSDGYIKPKYNHGLTPTGRLTCSGPNLQNIKG